jgi:SOS response regulatory protein OraA/RecX
MRITKTKATPTRWAALWFGALLLAGCASSPKPLDWQLEAKGAMDRSVAASMEGNSRVEQAELARARSQLARTGRADLLATAELLHCATRVASLVLVPCAGFEALRPDATETQRAYADYLRGQVTPQSIALLPAPQRAAAAGNADAVQGLADPLSQLVAASVLLQTGKANPAVIAQAIDTASAQGWRRPLLAWLHVQARRAELAGDAQAVATIRRRIALTQGNALSRKEFP